MSGDSPVIKLLVKLKAGAFSTPLSHSGHAENALAPIPKILVPRTGHVALVPFDACKTSVLTDFVEWLADAGAGREPRPELTPGRPGAGR